jgi:hypothetical protein
MSDKPRETTPKKERIDNRRKEEAELRAAEQAAANKWYPGKYGNVMGKTLYATAGTLLTKTGETLKGIWSFQPKTGNNSTLNNNQYTRDVIIEEPPAITTPVLTSDEQEKLETNIKQNYKNNYERLIHPLLKKIVIKEKNVNGKTLDDEIINIPDEEAIVGRPKTRNLITLKNAVFNRTNDKSKKYRIVYVYTTNSLVHNGHIIPTGDVDIKEIMHSRKDYTADGSITTLVPLSLLNLDDGAKEQNRYEEEDKNQDIFKTKRRQNVDMSSIQRHHNATINPNTQPRQVPRNNSLNAGGSRKTKSRRQHKRKSSKRR